MKKRPQSGIIQPYSKHIPNEPKRLAVIPDFSQLSHISWYFLSLRMNFIRRRWCHQEIRMWEKTGKPILLSLAKQFDLIVSRDLPCCYGKVKRGLWAWDLNLCFHKLESPKHGGIIQTFVYLKRFKAQRHVWQKCEPITLIFRISFHSKICCTHTFWYGLITDNLPHWQPINQSNGVVKEQSWKCAGALNPTSCLNLDPRIRS